MSDPTPPCPFCEIVAGRAPATYIDQWPDTIAIRPRGGVHPGHTLVIPRQHVTDYTDDIDITMASVRRAAQLGRTLNASNLITSAGTDATQTVMHLHWHLIPRASGDDITLPWTNRCNCAHGEAL